MIFLSWQDNYRIGVPRVDAEHEYLFALINEFHDKYAAGDTHRQQLLILNRLVAYAEEHFQNEEALMREAGYPRLDRQQAMHETLYSSIFALNEKLSRRGAKADAETMRFLKTWIVDHIVREDVDIGQFMRRKASQAEKVDQAASGETESKQAAATAMEG